MKADNRNQLALERTRLANERTLLAYIRTALSLLAAAVILMQFFSSTSSYITVAVILASSGFLVLIFGLIRFNQVRVKLNGY